MLHYVWKQSITRVIRVRYVQPNNSKLHMVHMGNNQSKLTPLHK